MKLPCTQISRSAEATRTLAAGFARDLTASGRGSVVALIGDLGAGKTCFVQGMAAGLGVSPRIPVNSPTYTLLNIYEGTMPLYHFDWYRLESDAALEGLGLDEYLDGDGMCVIEWADKFPHLLPAHTIRVVMTTTGPAERLVAFNLMKTG